MTNKSSGVWPVNADGAIVAQTGSGSTTIAGFLNGSQIPVDAANNKVNIVGLNAQPVALTASRHAVIADNNNILSSTSSSAFTVTIDAGMPLGFSLAVAQMGTGQITLTAGSGVTISNVSSYTKTSGQYAIISLINVAQDVYLLAGSGA